VLFDVSQKIMNTLEYGDFTPIRALLTECDTYQNSFIEEHSGYLRDHWGKFRGYKRQAEKDREWDRVSSEFYNLRSFIDSMIAFRAESGDSGTNGSGVQ
jgi:hypothetical protein